MNVHEITEYLTAAKSTLDIFKALRDEIPSGTKQKELSEQILRAEHSLTITNANAAKLLGYNLCQCTFPPQIMLSKGYHQTHSHKEVFVCPSCGRQEPSPAYFEQLDKNKAYNDSLPSGDDFINCRL